MSFSFVASAIGNADSGAASAGTTLNLLDGDLLVVSWENEGVTSGAPTFQKDTGSPANAFTFDAADHSVDGLSGGGYLLSAAADSSARFKLTLASQAFTGFVVQQFRSTGSVITKAGSAIAEGSSTAPDSGPLNIGVGADWAVVGWKGNISNDVGSARLLNALAATGATVETAYNNMEAWYRLFTTTFAAGHASCTGANVDWRCGILAFLATPGAAAAPLANVGFAPPPNQRMI